MDPLTQQAAVVAAGCLVATYTDVRWGKIYNWTTGAMVALGLAMNATFGDWQLAVWGLLASFAIHFTLWKLGIQKGGDAKLMIGVGTLLGAWFMVEATIWYAILYLPVGLLFLAVTGKLGNLKAVLEWHRMKQMGLAPGDKPPPTMMRTAPVIAAATLAAFATPWLHFVLYAS